MSRTFPRSTAIAGDIVIDERITNVPIDNLRTFVTLVDLRSYTRSAEALGVSQPTVSTQIKRLQDILGFDLFDKATPGVKLTARGEFAVSLARRLLVLNDQIVRLRESAARPRPVRIGVDASFAEAGLPHTLARIRAQTPDLGFDVRSDVSETLLRHLHEGDLDIAVALTPDAAAPQPRHRWEIEVVWAKAPDMVADPARPVPLVTYGGCSVYNRLATGALLQAGRDYDIVFTSANVASQMTAVAAGLGVTAMASRAVPPALVRCDDAALPPLPHIYCGVYCRGDADPALIGRIADAIADAFGGGVPTTAA